MLDKDIVEEKDLRRAGADLKEADRGDRGFGVWNRTGGDRGRKAVVPRSGKQIR
jgi:hypothetical protein